MGRNRRITGLIFVIVVALSINALRQSKHISTEIDIAAPPAAVWSALTDFKRYPDWNPFIRSIKGPLKAGQELQVVFHLPSAPDDGADDMAFEPTLLTVDPSRELRWHGRLWMPGLFDGDHWFRLEASAAGTRLIHGEDFNGLFLFMMDGEQTRQGFEAMNQALKKRVEAAR